MPDTTSDDPLIEKLVAAAERAIRAEGPGLTYDRNRLRGLHVELTIANGGAVASGSVYIERDGVQGPRH